MNKISEASVKKIAASIKKTEASLKIAAISFRKATKNDTAFLSHILICASIASMGVIPQYRRTGVGKHILERLYKEAANIGLYKTSLGVHKDITSY